ncbi:hypothetical protein [Endozoicomonas sp. SESOKO1]|uniref:hypothetical protein n=1 Tax=Endozoicomonas sp. SESOKO1 TaxID=2828742 RepID=UPI002148CB60|nr:hypothetical protein [Endozoicomonas sp. SESOKO1]
MRRRPDVIDALLENWASWRFIYQNLEFGTGNSSIVRFSEPWSTTGSHSVPLWQGRRTGRALLALNHDLTRALDSLSVTRLVAWYGTAGPIDRKASALGMTVNDLQALCHRARCIALSHIPQHLTAEIVHRDRYRHRSPKPEGTARPLPPVPAPHQD